MTATLLCWNVNSLTTTAKSLATFSRNSHPQIPDKSHPLINLFTAYQADIICFQETKLSTKTLANAKQHVCIPGYTSFHTLSKKPGYSGVATYVKNGKTKCAVAGYESEWFNDEEGRVMITDHGIFVLINLYVPNAGRGGDTLLYKMQFYESLKRYIRHLQEKGREIIICGDLNTAHGEIDIWNPAKFANSSGFLPEERAFLDSLESDLKLTDTYRYVNPTQRCYTFWDTRTCKREVNLGWRIDYFFVSEGLRSKITKAEILNDVFGSDHCPLLLCLDVELSRDYPTPANATSDSVMFKDTVS
ncbi:Endonuclease/exonuclease/phosphatase [Paraphysoderma sedebokerense]|nr:Endonuclease/exonuclease/phosphatase [Paraphysoderma sedebokerense]